jgi:hypothetical protein
MKSQLQESSIVKNAEVQPGDILRLWHGGELVLAAVAQSCANQVKTVTEFAPGLVCISDLRWSGGHLIAGRGVEFEVGRMPRRLVG